MFRKIVHFTYFNIVFIWTMDQYRSSLKTLVLFHLLEIYIAIFAYKLQPYSMETVFS